jgi:hypothetical protein
MYELNEFLHLAQFEYKVSEGEPDSFESIQNTRGRLAFSTWAILTQLSYIVYVYLQAFFGDVATFELFFLLGLNCSWF